STLTTDDFTASTRLESDGSGGACTAMGGEVLSSAAAGDAASAGKARITPARAAARRLVSFMVSSVRLKEMNARGLLMGTLLSACVAHLGPKVTRWVAATLPKNHSTPPLIPRRDQCLKPPYTVEALAQLF